MVVEIRLSQQGKHKGKFVAMVDDCDSDLGDFRWNIFNLRYAQREDAENKKVSMHRVILERVLGRVLEKGEYVDHIDGHGLNNTRANLRLATQSQNMMNQGIRSDNTSGYKGVSFHKGSGLYKAELRVDGKVYAAYAKTAEEAYEKRKKLALEHHKSFGRNE